MKFIIEVWNRDKVDEIIELFILVWSQDSTVISAKTEWAIGNRTKSKILVMKNEKNDLISVRGGMKWPLQIERVNINAYQLHGTCVHPAYRRQGLFSKINTEFVNQAVSEDFQLIFNVSVKASMLGYQKLGWKYVKGFRRLTKFNSPINIAKVKALKTKIERKNGKANKQEDICIPDEFFKIRNEHFVHVIHTEYDAKFLKWRLSNQEENYKTFTTNYCIVVYKIKHVGGLKELIVGEVFLIKHKFAFFKEAIYELTKIERQDVTYTYIFNSHPYYKYYLRLFFIPNPFNYNLNFGARTLGLENDDLLDNKKWGLGFLDIDTF